ncbi:MAG: HU family DNA-binding protein [Candidatus Latescibacteria bacterium]|nr:HU family DNA-binding protein [Candidatus Latescibacterota bacterium]
MSKDEIISKAAADADISKAAAGSVIGSVIDSITGALAKGDKVSFVGFGTFSVWQRAARTGKNPRTGATIQIPATIVPKFKAGKSLKEAVS